MDELTPDERSRIYLEEKTRLEKKRPVGAFIGFALLGFIALLLVLFAVGSAMEQSSATKFASLTPEQKHAETLRNCESLRRGWEFKTYAELTPQERKAKASCEYYASGGR